MGNTLCPPAGDGRRPPRKDKDKDKDKGKGKDKKHHSSKSKSDKKKSSKSKGKEVDAGAGEEGEIPLQDMPRPGQPREWDSQYYDMNDPGPSALFESARVPLGVPVPPQGQGQYQNYQAEAQDPNLEQERRGRPREAYMSGAADGETQGARVPYSKLTNDTQIPKATTMCLESGSLSISLPQIPARQILIAVIANNRNVDDAQSRPRLHPR